MDFYKMEPNTSEKFLEDGIHVETINIASNPTREVVYTDREARRVLRKLDFWIMPVLMFSYGLQ